MIDLGVTNLGSGKGRLGVEVLILNQCLIHDQRLVHDQRLRKQDQKVRRAGECGLGGCSRWWAPRRRTTFFRVRRGEDDEERVVAGRNGEADGAGSTRLDDELRRVCRGVQSMCY